MTDIATRLLVAAVASDRDEIAKEVRHMDVWEDKDDVRSPGWHHAECHCGWTSSGYESVVEDAVQVHVLERHCPRAVKLAAAVREITEFHMVCQADYALAAEKVATYAGIWPAEQVELEAASRDALVRLQLSDHCLSILARAYGVEEDG